MYGSGSRKASEDCEWTAFRRAEKKYKLYYDDTAKPSKKKKQPKPVDLTEVIDFKAILECCKKRVELPAGIFPLQTDSNHHVFCLENRPGFYFIPGALSVEEQCKWIRESLINFPQPPNRTNHNAIYGPIHDLFTSAREGKALIEAENAPSNSCTDSRWKVSKEDAESLRAKKCKSVSAKVLLRKLRWSTLGLQFNWSKRNYDLSLAHNKIPEDICHLAKVLAKHAMAAGVEFHPEAAIVNYFGLGDTLGGHLDDMEADWSKPIVSMSLGCKAIFLLGGKSREDTPLAMFLRSGDVVLMTGEARECFHGVPRIFTEKENAEINHIEPNFSNEDDFCFLEYIQNSRININIRQVF